MPELERLAGSLLCVGVPAEARVAPMVGASPAAGEREFFERLHLLGPGGIVLFARNVASIDIARALVDALCAALGDSEPPSICIDQEGGRVARIALEMPMPSAMTVGASGDAELAERTGAALAATVRAVGANVNFAPVLDLALDADSTVIGNRAFGDDPATVAELGAAVVRGLQDAGVAATPKHFPGHGATPDDSHVAAPTVYADAATLRRRELVPFRAAFAAGARAVMTAHVSVPAFDDALPATLSPRILRDLLRDELGFEGVAFTDCLEMSGVAERFGGPAGAGVRALAAGADVLLVSHDLGAAEALRTAIVQAVLVGDVPLARVEEAATRVHAFRRQHRAGHVLPAISPEAAAAVAGDVAVHGVARVRGDLRLDLAEPVTVVSFEGASGDGIAGGAAERPSLNLALRRRRVRSELLRVALEPDAQMREQLVNIIAAQNAQGARNVIVLARRAHLHAEQRRAIDALLNVVPVAVVVSLREPFDIMCFPRAQRIACTFGDEATNIEALADVLIGRQPACGKLPVTLKGTDACGEPSTFAPAVALGETVRRDETSDAVGKTAAERA